jgi:hypothetical protein
MTLDDRFYSIRLHARVYADRGNGVTIRHASSMLAGMALHDPGEWEPEFNAWVLHRCIFRDSCISNTAALYAAFCDWCLSNRSVPCRTDTFEELLTRNGFCIDAAMVHGLILKIDFKTLVQCTGAVSTRDAH